MYVPKDIIFFMGILPSGCLGINNTTYMHLLRGVAALLPWEEFVRGFCKLDRIFLKPFPHI